METYHYNIPVLSESDVEQKIVYPLLSNPIPIGMGYVSYDILTKADIRKLVIDKGKNQRLYFPDYAIIIDGLPAAIIEVKAPNQDLENAAREARLYASEINATFKRNINPCSRIIVTDGIIIKCYYWDENEPTVAIPITDLVPLNENFHRVLQFIGKTTVETSIKSLKKSIRKDTRFVRPVTMLGGKSIENATVGENSFGSNISLEYRYLFNPDTMDERNAIATNAYVPSKRKLSHVAPIDKIIRATLPRSAINSTKIDNTSNPVEMFDQISRTKRNINQLCILIGSVGSGKSTFTDYLREVALPSQISDMTDWVNVNLNKAPINRELIYKWLVDQCINSLKAKFTHIDFDHIDTIKKLYSKELRIVEKGRAALFPQDSEKYLEIISEELKRLQLDYQCTLAAMIRFLFTGQQKLLIVVLDNCDKRNRDDQLLMFEVATWLKDSFECMVFLPLRDSTYDQYGSEPPLDTVIKDLVFRIDPPLLEKVIYARLHYALREMDQSNKCFTYMLPNNARVECKSNEVASYLKCMVSSLFQDHLFKRIITGLAGRNIRKGLEILLDFCKSGHISEEEIFKIRQSNGEYSLPSHLIARLLFRGMRRFYCDEHSNIKNLFHSDPTDDLPDPFIRVLILQWLKNKFRDYGPTKQKGFHKFDSLITTLQQNGHVRNRIISEAKELRDAGCIVCESQVDDMSPEDLIAITPAGFTHLSLLDDTRYLSTIAEDTYFRNTEIAKAISINMTSQGLFSTAPKQAELDTCKHLLSYLDDYRLSYLFPDNLILADENSTHLFEIKALKNTIEARVASDSKYIARKKLIENYPTGTWVEAQITSVKDFGFFVEFDVSGFGLVHKSNFGVIPSYKISQLEEGNWVIVEIIEYRSDHKKFYLKLVDV